MSAHRRTSVRSYRKRQNGKVIAVSSHRRGYVASSGRKHYRRDATSDPSFELRKIREARKSGAKIQIINGRVKTFLSSKDEDERGFVDDELADIRGEAEREQLIRRGILPRNQREVLNEASGSEPTVNLQEAFRLKLSSKESRVSESQRLRQLKERGIVIDPVSGLGVDRAKNLVNRAEAFSRKTGNSRIEPEDFAKSSFLSFDKKGDVISFGEAKKIEARPSREKPRPLYKKSLERQEAAEKIIEQSLKAREKGEKVRREDVIKLGASKLLLPSESRQMDPAARSVALGAAKAQAERIMDMEIQQRKFQQGFEKDFGPITGGKKIERVRSRSPFRE